MDGVLDMNKVKTINCFTLSRSGAVSEGIRGVLSGIVQNTAKNPLTDPAHYLVEETSWEGYKPNAIGAVLEIKTSESNLFVSGEVTTLSAPFAETTLITLAPGAKVELRESLAPGAAVLWAVKWDGAKLYAWMGY